VTVRKYSIFKLIRDRRRNLYEQKTLIKKNQFEILNVVDETICAVDHTLPKSSVAVAAITNAVSLVQYYKTC